MRVRTVHNNFINSMMIWSSFRKAGMYACNDLGMHRFNLHVPLSLPHDVHHSKPLCQRARRFIQSLKQSDPPDVGITGPLDLNNERLMTQSFASCKHYEIFGFYYPWHFKNWYSDDW